LTYQETLDFLFQQLPMYQRQGKAAYKADLSNILALCDAIDNPQQKFKSVHVGGTNGKGSVTHYLASVFMEAGYKVGTYTSPHYVDFRERIRINGSYISKKAVISFVEQIEPLLLDIQPSFFEITVAMAFQYFSEQQVDFAIVEVGLGGRLDSTNIITPQLSIITNIGLDHQQILGDTLEKIATEKAGIIKPGVPIIIGKSQTETAPIFKRIASENKAEIIFADQFIEDESMIEFMKSLPLPNYQLENLRTVATAYQQLNDTWSLTNEHFCKGVENVQQNSTIIGRWQVLNQNPFTVADSAHNIDGIKQFLVEISKRNTGELHLIYGTVSDKNIDSVAHLFPKNAHYYLTAPSVPRKMPVEQLKAEFPRFTNVETYLNVSDAFSAASAKAKPIDTIAIFGSIFLVADHLKNM